MDKKYLIKKNNLFAEVVNGQVVSFSIEGVDILYKGSSIKRSGIPVLFPFANPLKNNIFDRTGKSISQHGFARNSKWDIVKEGDDSVIFKLDSKNIERKYKDVYPFEFILIQEIKLSENSLSLKFIIENKSSVDMPIAPGLHPYFLIDHGEKKEFIFSGSEGFNPKNFDWENPGNGVFYPWLSNSILKTKKYTVEISSTKGFFPYNVVWSQNIQQSDFNFVCLEPFSKPSNGININPVILRPNDSKVFTYSIKKC